MSVLESVVPGPTPDTTHQSNSWLPKFLLRLHFYAGIFVGPFVFVAAVTGMIYAIAPPAEEFVHRDLLKTPAYEHAVPVADQVAAAQAHTGLSTVRGVKLSDSPTSSTTVLLKDPDLPARAMRGVYVNAGTGEVLGELTLHGRGGKMPVTQWLSTFHKDLHLGKVGVLYSELAASWLGIVCLAGFGLWWRNRRKKSSKKIGRARSKRLHTQVGLWSLVGLLFLAATGVTWSDHAGANVKEVRNAMNWNSPRLNTTVSNDTTKADLTQVDRVIDVARNNGIDSASVQVTPPTRPGTAWRVSEIDRTVPTQMDEVAIHPGTFEVTARHVEADKDIVSKLITWGILGHFGHLFGLPNLMVLFGLGLAASILVVYGYVMWWQRRPTKKGFGRAYPRGALTQMPKPVAAAVIMVAVAVGWFLPTVGWTLLAFVVLDVLLALRHGRGTATKNQS